MAKNIKNQYNREQAADMNRRTQEMMNFRRKHITKAPNGEDCFDMRHMQENMPYAMLGMSKEQADMMLSQMVIDQLVEQKKRQLEFMEEYKDQFAKFRPEKYSKMFFNSVPKNPHASMKMEESTITLLGSLWGCSMNMDELELGDEGWDIPTDIIWSGTVSVRDIEFNFGIHDASGVAEISKARIIIDDNYREKLQNLAKGDEVTIGKILIFMSSHNTWLGTDLMMNGTSPDAFFYAPVFAMKGQLREGIVIFEASLERVLLYYLAIWYGTQLAFLHPLTKTCIVDKDAPAPKPRKVYNHKAGKKRVLENIRYQYLDGETLEKVLYHSDCASAKSKSKGRTYQRHTQLWHVRGFTKANGTFVQPYWKGPLAKVKNMVVAQARERTISGVTVEDGDVFN